MNLFSSGNERLDRSAKAKRTNGVEFVVGIFQLGCYSHRKR